MNKQAHIILSDGRIFSGKSFGYQGNSSGEVVFNTSMSGYQEILTDPSYHKQIVVMTYPEIGNYGINVQDMESRNIYLSGFIVKSVSPIVSNYRAKEDLNSYLLKHKIPGIEGIDTRALVRHIRDKGAMQACIVLGALKNEDAMIRKARELPSMEGQNLAKYVSCKKRYSWTKGTSSFLKEKKKSQIQKMPYHVVAYDFGIKHNILRMLVDRGCRVTVVPYDYSSTQVLAEKPDGIFLSNGPGDPAACHEAIENVKMLIGQKPIFGICLGHQIAALALGLQSFKLKFGHHGGNQPVMDMTTRKVEISAQNHGFAIDVKNIPEDVDVTHMNLNDKTVEGLAHRRYPLFSVQYHPEASPGPHDSSYLFDRFLLSMKDGKVSKSVS